MLEIPLHRSCLTRQPMCQHNLWTCGKSSQSTWLCRSVSPGYPAADGSTSFNSSSIADVQPRADTACQKRTFIEVKPRARSFVWLIVSIHCLVWLDTACPRACERLACPVPALKEERQTAKSLLTVIRKATSILGTAQILVVLPSSKLPLITACHATTFHLGRSKLNHETA